MPALSPPRGVIRAGTDHAEGALDVPTQDTVFCNNALVVRMGDRVVGHGSSPHSPHPTMETACTTVFVDGQAVCGNGDFATCCHPAIPGSSNTFIGGPVDHEVECVDPCAFKITLTLNWSGSGSGGADLNAYLREDDLSTVYYGHTTEGALTLNHDAWPRLPVLPITVYCTGGYTGNPGYSPANGNLVDGCLPVPIGVIDAIDSEVRVSGASPAGGTVTMTIASPCVVSKTSHGYANNRRVSFKTTGSLPTGLTTNVGGYYVVNATTDTFELSLTSGGASINTSGTQSGTHTIFDQYYSSVEVQAVDAVGQLVISRHTTTTGLFPRQSPASYNVTYDGCVTWIYQGRVFAGGGDWCSESYKMGSNVLPPEVITGDYNIPAAGTVMFHAWYNQYSDSKPQATPSTAQVVVENTGSTSICVTVDGVDHTVAGGDSVTISTITYGGYATGDMSSFTGGTNILVQCAECPALTPTPTPPPPMEIVYAWVGGGESDVFTETSFLGNALGWYTHGLTAPYMSWQDFSNTPSPGSGHEDYHVSVDDAHADSMWATTTTIYLAADWWYAIPTGSSATVTVTYNGITWSRTINPGFVTELIEARTAVGYVTVFANGTFTLTTY
jgi:uncharacterized Zn-binding protein involved in type VI secretion